MSITEELRKWAARELASWKMARERFDALTAIADRIDAEHKRLMQEQPFTVDMVPMTDERMAEHGWVRLPVDADGETIHIGDKLTHGKTSFVVEHIDLHHWGWRVIGDGIDGNGYECTAHAIPDDCHHHAPTVEDVLREFAQEMSDNMGMYAGEAIDADEWRDADAKTIAEYAAKLRLAGDDE